MPPPPNRMPQLSGQQRLLSRIQRRYPTVTREIVLHTLKLPFTCAADPDRVLDEAVEREEQRTKRPDGELEEIHLPYWAELWESAFALSLWIESNCDFSHKPSTLDLGCGMGLAGTVAAALGARVTFADIETPALLFARLNSLPYRQRVCARRVNWKRDRLNERFDLILGADILYDRSQWEFLDTFWRNHLAEKGRVILGEPGRQTGESFPGWIKEKGWRFETTTIAIPQRPRPLNVFLLSLP